ncbi:MAG: winged helix DNA-binding protein [Nitrososphaerales archaeon]
MIVTIASITLFISIVVLARYLPEIRGITKEQKDASEIVKGVLSELHNRLGQQDQKILDQQVRLDIIELKLDQLSKALGKEEKEAVKVHEVSDTKRILEEVKDLLKNLGKSEPMPSKIQQKEEVKGIKILEELSPTESLVLKLLMEGAQTPKQIQQRIKKSREHTARLMKRLFELGYVIREEKKRPYVYEITEKGKELMVRE